MKKLLPLYGVLALALLGFFLWTARLWPFDGHPEPVDVAFDELSVELDTVRVSGTAHYNLRMTQDRPGRFGRADLTWHVFPLFAKGDTISRKIEVIVATPHPPDDLATYEDMTVEGWALPPAAAMTPASEDLFHEAGYSFTEDYFVIEVFEPES